MSTIADNTLRFNFLVGRNELPAAADKNAGKLSMLGSKTASFGKVAAVALGGAALAAGGMAAAGAVMGVKTAASLEQAQIGFTTLLGSSRKAGDYLAKLKTFAAATPFELPGLIESSRTLFGVGVSANDAMKILQTFGDTAAAVGIDQQHFQNIMIATSQAIGAGRFMTADLNQITNNGIPIWTILSKAMGKPIPVLRDLASHGKLLSKDVLPVLEKQMGKDYGGAMAKQSQTLAGLWSTLMDTLNLGLASVIQPLMPALKSLATNGIAFLGSAFQKLPGMITTAMTWLSNVKDYVSKNVLPGIRSAIGTIGDRLPRINLADLFADVKGIGARVAAVLLPAGAAILAAAQAWGGRILDGITTGLHAGNWGPLGKTLGDGVIAALTGAASLGARLARVFTGWFASIDWLAIGKTVGAQAIPFAIGFVNSLFDGLFNVARNHPMDLVLFVAAFIPLGKFAAAFGPLRSAIEHLPLGSWFTWLLDHTAVPVFDAIKGFLGFIFKAFRDGFGAWFPGITKTFSGFWLRITTEIGVRAIDAGIAARNFVYGIAHGVGSATGGVVKAIGTLIGDMIRPFARAGGWVIGKGVDFVVGLTRGALSVLGRVGAAAGSVISRLVLPFARAGGWLIARGADAISGLTRGIGSMLGRVSALTGSVVSRVTGAFRGAAGWLVGAGRNVIQGFWNGLTFVWKKVIGWVSGIASWIAQHKGPIHLDAKLLVPAGMAIMTGFYKGLQSGAGKAWDFVKSVGGKTVAALSSALGMAGGIAVQGGGNSANRQMGQKMAAFYGWTGNQWAALNNLWMGESGWNNFARNPSSGAFGIPQALPPGKMGAAAASGNAAAQIAWGLRYIRDVYGSPANAYAKWLARRPHWYDTGGLARGAGVWAKGPKPERILSPRQTEAFERLVPMLSRGGGAAQVNVTLQITGHAVAFEDKIVGAVRSAVGSGRLSRAVLPGVR